MTRALSWHGPHSSDPSLAPQRDPGFIRACHCRRSLLDCRGCNSRIWRSSGGPSPEALPFRGVGGGDQGRHALQVIHAPAPSRDFEPTAHPPRQTLHSTTTDRAARTEPTVIAETVGMLGEIADQFIEAGLTGRRPALDRNCSDVVEQPRPAVGQE